MGREGRREGGRQNFYKIFESMVKQEGIGVPPWLQGGGGFIPVLDREATPKQTLVGRHYGLTAFLPAPPLVSSSQSSIEREPLRLLNPFLCLSFKGREKGDSLFGYVARQTRE